MKRSYNLFSLTLPYFIALILMLSSFSFFLGRFVSPKQPMASQERLSYVLGDDDEDEDEDESEDKDDEDEDRDNDERDEDDSDDGNEDEDEDRDDDANEDEDENSIENELEDDELDDSDEDGDESVETSSVITNANGSRMEIRRKVEGDKIHVKIETFDMFGKKVSEQEYEEKDDGRIEYQAEVKNVSGEDTNQVITMDYVASKLQGLGVTYNVTEMKIEAEGNKEVVKLKGYKTEKFLGLINVLIPSDLTMEGDGSALLSQNSSFIAKLLDALSF